MRVLLVGKAAPERGGIAAFLGDLRDGPLAEQVEVTLHNLTRPDETPQGGALTWSNVRRTVGDAMAVARAARGHDVVHLHSALAPGVTMVRAGVLVLAARLARRPVVVHAHGGRLIKWLDGPLRRLVTRVALRPAARVVAVAEPVRAALGTVVAAQRLSVVANGVDLQRFRPPDPPRPDRVPRVLYVGLLTARKGVVDLLDASERLRDAGVAHELVLVGGVPDEGPHAARVVVERARHAGATMVGSVPHADMPTVYRDADVFCLPSWWEAMPLTVLEAMASGLPVVASAVGAVPDLLPADGTAGTRVAPRDVAALTEALAPLLRDRALRRRLGDAARVHAASFDHRTTAQALADLYAAVRR